MPFPSLPIELCEAVIDDLGVHNDKTTLRACSLTCKAFLPASRYHLFYHVILSDTSKAQRFLDVVCSTVSSTDPAPYVRRLSILEPGGSQWMNVALPLLTTRLFEITMLELDSFMFDGTTKAAMISGFMKVKCLKCTFCSFETTHQTSQIIASFPNLTELSLLRSDLGSGGLRMLLIPLPHHLKAIALNSSHSLFFDKLLSFESHPAVHTIQFPHMPPQHIQGMGKLLKSLGSSLEHLELGFSHSVDQDVDAINLAHNTDLRSISLPYGSSLTLLSRITSFHLTRVSVNFFGVLNVSDLHGVDWDGIENIFTQERWANLRELIISLHGFKTGGADATALAEYVRACLPLLESRGFFNFRFDET